MQKFTPSARELLEHLNRLPGVGPKTAKRYLFHLLREPAGDLYRFSAALAKLPNELTVCGLCGTYSEQHICELCADSRRKTGMLCVVADHEDMGAIENTSEFRGRYHLLGGVLSPLDGITPERLRIRELLSRIKTEDIKEVILALNPDMEGESTMLYLSKLLSPLQIKVTRLARGLPMGSDLEYADEITLTDAIRGRREIGKT